MLLAPFKQCKCIWSELLYEYGNGSLKPSSLDGAGWALGTFGNMSISNNRQNCQTKILEILGRPYNSFIFFLHFSFFSFS